MSPIGQSDGRCNRTYVELCPNCSTPQIYRRRRPRDRASSWDYASKTPEVVSTARPAAWLADVESVNRSRAGRGRF